MDWGLCGTIIAVIAFIATQMNESKIKKLNDRVAKTEKNVEPLYNELFKIQGDVNDA